MNASASSWADHGKHISNPDKTLETKTLDAGRGPTEFSGRAGNADETLDTGASNVVTTSPAPDPLRNAGYASKTTNTTSSENGRTVHRRLGARLPTVPARAPDAQR